MWSSDSATVCAYTFFISFSLTLTSQPWPVHGPSVSHPCRAARSWFESLLEKSTDGKLLETFWQTNDPRKSATTQLWDMQNCTTIQRKQPKEKLPLSNTNMQTLLFEGIENKQWTVKKISYTANRLHVYTPYLLSNPSPEFEVCAGRASQVSWLIHGSIQSQKIFHYDVNATMLIVPPLSLKSTEPSSGQV